VQVERDRKKVIVIGLGATDLAAAKKLLEDGFEVVALEARDRVGGRVDTICGPNQTPLERGANWIHPKETEINNPSYRY